MLKHEDRDYITQTMADHFTAQKVEMGEPTVLLGQGLLSNETRLETLKKFMSKRVADDFKDLYVGDDLCALRTFLKGIS